MRVRFLPPAIFLGCLVACRIAAQQDSFAITQALASNEFERALQLVSSKLKTNAVDPRLWTLRGMALNGLGNTKEGLASFRRALRYQGDYLPALLGKAEIEYRTGLPEARATLRRILTANPELATAHAMVGVLEFERNNHTQAAAHFEKPAMKSAGIPSPYGNTVRACIFPASHSRPPKSSLRSWGSSRKTRAPGSTSL